MDNKHYFNYIRRTSTEARAGHVTLGGNHAIRLQSMTTTATADVAQSVAQSEAIARAGAELVRLTAQGMHEVEALKEIKAQLVARGVTTPLVADIHFNPAVADAAAQVVDKVRINPGNYVDAARTFKHLEYTDDEYAAELQRIEDRLLPLLDICRRHHTAIRIGVNHGSLSDRIMSRYGDTPEGIVESCMEFLRICQKHCFDNIVLSIKASATIIMVRSVRLLVEAMEREGMAYPLHLGVTEAGEGEDGRIRSAVGIGALLADGYGDTIRVSLSEAPENEIPVARHLRNHLIDVAFGLPIDAEMAPQFDYCRPERRQTTPVGRVGGRQAPVVISERTDLTGTETNLRPDYVYCGQTLPVQREDGTGYLLDYEAFQALAPQPGVYPCFSYTMLEALKSCTADQKFLFLPCCGLTDEVADILRQDNRIVVIAQNGKANPVGQMRALLHRMMNRGLTTPVVLFGAYAHTSSEVEAFQIESAAEVGALLADGLCDGLYLSNTVLDGQRGIAPDVCERTAFAILQAAGLRKVRPEYISCPGCGRTLYDLQSTIARVKDATKGLKNLKIAIMGCIVNGPGEMADADYGYVGAARGKISLYRGKECVERNIPEAEAVEHLLALLRSDGVLE